MGRRYRDPAGREHSNTFDTQREAKAWVAERERDVRRGECLPPTETNTTISDLAHQWARAATRPNTIANRQALIANLGPLSTMPAHTTMASSPASPASMSPKPRRPGRSNAPTC